MLLGDDETVNDVGEVVAIEIEGGQEEEILECKIMGLCGITKDISIGREA